MAIEYVEGIDGHLEACQVMWQMNVISCPSRRYDTKFSAGIPLTCMWHILALARTEGVVKVYWITPTACLKLLNRSGPTAAHVSQDAIHELKCGKALQGNSSQSSPLSNKKWTLELTSGNIPPPFHRHPSEAHISLPNIRQ